MLISQIFQILTFLACLGIFWCLVSFILGQVTGWTKLAAKHPHNGPLPSKNLWKNCSIQNLAIRNGVNVALDDQGMYFEMVFLFRWGNPSIFIPWSDISMSESECFFVKTTVFSFKNIPDMTFHFDKKTAAKFLDAKKNRL